MMKMRAGISGSLLAPFHDYLIYGFSIRSQFPISHFPSAGKPSARSIVISQTASPLAISEKGHDAWFFQKNLADGSIYLRWSGLFEFLVSSNGRRISARPLERSSPEAFSTYLLGQVLSFALVKMGFESLHSSAVVINGSCVGFLGDCGQGKSTMLAGFLGDGHKQLTDDLLLLRIRKQSIRAYPGPPRIKLMSDSARLLRNADGVPMNDLVPKKIIPLNANQFQKTCVPLKALYLLRGGSGGTIKIAEISGRKAILTLIKNSFNVSINDTKRLEQQFAWAAAIASRTPIRAVSYPRTVAALPSVRAAIIDDLGRLPKF